MGWTEHWPELWAHRLQTTILEKSPSMCPRPGFESWVDLRLAMGLWERSFTLVLWMILKAEAGLGASIQTV